jgi:acyl transferase domain-containing protein/phosphopantetheinyl transferase
MNQNLPSPNNKDGKTIPQNTISIVGMACRFPDAPDLNTFWQNICKSHNAVHEVSSERWDIQKFYSKGHRDKEKIYCKQGGYLENSFPFDPSPFGIMPAAVKGGSPEQFLVLQTAREALLDAGYKNLPLKKGIRAEFILGLGNYLSVGQSNVFQRTNIIDQTIQILKQINPDLSGNDLRSIQEELQESLLPFRPETAPSIIPNITSSLTSNRFHFIGPCFTVDAACASSLISVEIALRDLESGSCDLALSGGIHIQNNVPFLSVFSAVQALSRSETIRPFDKNADGTVPGEGVGILVLKRLNDAIRDNNRIYALIKAVGTSSDGRTAGVLAPSEKGQVLSMETAYQRANLSARTIGLIEAHGAGTQMGDDTEIKSLLSVFGKRPLDSLPTALGSVKSMIGHSMPAAGAAGIIKCALSLYHKVLPPSLNCSDPDQRVTGNKKTVHINTRLRPWIHSAHSHPRRAAVNAFGFGGINAHAILEEYSNPSLPSPLFLNWDTELFLFKGKTTDAVLDRARKFLNIIKKIKSFSLTDWAFTLNSDGQSWTHCLSVVADSRENFIKKLDYAIHEMEQSTRTKIQDKRGIYFSKYPQHRRGKIAFLYPGEGSQYIDMLKDIYLNFPEVRNYLDLLDYISLQDRSSGMPPSWYYFPPLLKNKKKAEDDLFNQESSRITMIISNLIMDKIIDSLGIKPDTVGGHSSGELSASVKAGIYELNEFMDSIPRLQELFHIVSKLPDVPKGSMLAVSADKDKITKIISSYKEKIYLANDNCPHQVVIAGSRTIMEKLFKELMQGGILCHRLPYKYGYHTQMFAIMEERLHDFLSSLTIHSPSLPLYSCITGKRYPGKKEEIISLSSKTWSMPVDFFTMIESMYHNGARTFIEVGPRSNLSAFVDDILRNRPHVALPSNVSYRSGTTQINHLAGLLASLGYPVKTEYLYTYRKKTKVDLNAKPDIQKSKKRQSIEIFLSLPEAKVKKREKKALQKRLPQEIEDFDAPLSSLHLTREGEKNREEVIHGFLDTMEKFLQVQEDVMKSYYKGLSPNIQTEATGEKHLIQKKRAPENRPFIQEITGLSNQNDLKATCTLDMKEMLFLDDHRFFRSIMSLSDPALKPLSVVPLTISLEIMAEAAYFLMEGKILSGFRSVSTLNWLSIQNGQKLTLSVSAKKIDSHKVKVGIFTENRTPAAKAVVLFSNQYPEQAVSSKLNLLKTKRSRLSANQVYKQKLMFHGPSFQGISSLDELSPDGVQATLKVLPVNKIFHSIDAPDLLFDPFLVDAAGQVIGCWTPKYLKDGFVVFPAAIEKLNIWRKKPKVRDKLKCTVRIKDKKKKSLTVDFELVDSSGHVYLDGTGWTDIRLPLKTRTYQFLKRPQQKFLSQEWKINDVYGFNTKQEFNPIICFLPELFGIHETFWSSVWAHFLLSRKERQIFKDLSSARKADWLAGRIAAKDAVRLWLKCTHHIQVFPADVEIYETEGNRLLACGKWEEETNGEQLLISLSHSNGQALAITASQVHGIGIDMEIYENKPAGFEKISLSAKERKILDTLKKNERLDGILRFWCAKEALGKALGTGLSLGPKSFEVIRQENKNILIMKPGRKMLSSLTNIPDRTYKAYTIRRGKNIASFVILE